MFADATIANKTCATPPRVRERKVFAVSHLSEVEKLLHKLRIQLRRRCALAIFNRHSASLKNYGAVYEKAPFAERRAAENCKLTGINPHTSLTATLTSLSRWATQHPGSTSSCHTLTWPENAAYEWDSTCVPGAHELFVDRAALDRAGAT